MRLICGFLLSCLILSFGFATSTGAQTTSNAASGPGSVLRSLTLTTKFAEFQKHATFHLLSPDKSQDAANPEVNLQKRARDFLQHALDRNLLSDSGECGHILIYVPPVTDTKMIIKVPENAKAPDSAPDGRATPAVKVCGQDLRRVDTPRPAPRLNPNRDGALVPLHEITLPH